jgi:hypothetical protein
MGVARIVTTAADHGQFSAAAVAQLVLAGENPWVYIVD